VEYACYSDAPLSGLEVVVGPYRLLNTLATAVAPRPGSSRLALVLRAEQHLQETGPPESFWERTDTTTYHGGQLDDELAALISLALGIRLRSGGIIREFGTDDDPRGRPREWDHHIPYLAPPGRRGRVLPARVDQVQLTDCSSLLERYPVLPPDQAIALVRAARAYQEALWIVEDDPRQAWLRLVSAVEAAAAHWGLDEVPEQRLRRVQPRLAAMLEAQGEDHLRQVAAELNRIYGVTGKLIRFLMTFAPDPPPERPPYEHQRVEWSKIKDHLGMIYRYRSADLHAGTPFPLPMCEPPHQDPDAAPDEVPLGTGTGIGPEQASWSKADTPMLLHVFEGIVRRALRAWWMSVPAEAPVTPVVNHGSRSALSRLRDLFRNRSAQG